MNPERRWLRPTVSVGLVAGVVCMAAFGLLLFHLKRPAIRPLSLSVVEQTNQNGKPLVVFHLDSPQGNPPLQCRIYVDTADTTNYKGWANYSGREFRVQSPNGIRGGESLEVGVIPPTNALWRLLVNISKTMNLPTAIRQRVSDAWVTKDPKFLIDNVWELPVTSLVSTPFVNPVPLNIDPRDADFAVGLYEKSLGVSNSPYATFFPEAWRVGKSLYEHGDTNTPPMFIRLPPRQR